ncbi:hypothetical protein [Streptomyces sp. ISL-10]|uniref:hypothetical protein n=1 Tax=Streptomyces sp. ISL-10 TaxID=2819172 RepID=UPI0035ABA24A
MGAWSARALRENVEWSSLSPDGTRLVFKKKVRDDPRRPWRLHALDLRTMRERPLAETRGVDDQVAWLDDERAAYALAPGDIWSVPASGAGRPALLVRGATSPPPVR